MSRADALAAAGLAAIALLIHGEALRPDRVFYERDIGNYWYPQVEAFVGAVAEGAWPVWSPRFSFGLPMWADPAYQIAYPPTWLNLVVLPATYYKLFVIVHCFVAGWGLYTLSRRLGSGGGPAFVGAVVFCASGPLVSAASLFHHYASAAWMPWVLVALHRALAAGTAGSALALGAVAGAQLLAGSADVAWMTALIATAFAVASIAAAGRARAVERAVRSLRLAGVAAPYALALASAQWLPTLDYARVGSRLSMPATENLYWSIHPLSLVDVVAFRYFADPTPGRDVAALLSEGREPFLAALYLGAVAAAIVALSVALGDRPQRLLAAGLLFFGALALGRHTPLLPWLLHVPPMGAFRYPSKYFFAVALTWALLAAYGLDQWLKDWNSRQGSRARIVALLLVFAGAGALVVATLWGPAGPAGPWPPVQRLAKPGWLLLGAGSLAAIRAQRGLATANWTGLLMALAALLDCVVAGRSVNGLAVDTLLRTRPRVVQAIWDDAQRASPWARDVRVYAGPTDWDDFKWRTQAFSHWPMGWDEGWAWQLGLIDSVRPPTAARWRLDGSFDGDFTGLTPQPISFLSRILAVRESDWVKRRLLELGGVNYVVAVSPYGVAGLIGVGEFPSVYSAPIRLLRVPDPLPRSYVVDGVRAAGIPESLGILFDRGFEPAREIVLEAPAAPRRPSAGFSAKSSVVARTADRVVLEVEANADGYVVLLETFLDGWRARVDGRPERVLRANATFRAVRVPAGRHEVEMVYRPASVPWGLAATAAAGAGGLGFWEWRRRRAASRQPAFEERNR